MGIITKKVVVKTVANQELEKLNTNVSRISNLKVIAISTRTDGKTDGKLTVINDAKLKTINLVLKNQEGQDVQDVSLYRIKTLSENGNGYGLQVNSMVNFEESYLTYNDPAAMVTGEALELTFECEQ